MINTPRPWSAVDTLTERRLGPHLVTRDVQLSELTPELDPFLMVSLYSMRGPTFPPHPHAGFMVATYILPESEIGFVNQDSLGTRNRIAPGSLHVTVAGRGVLHEEQPEIEGPMAQGFQIWIDLPKEHREQVPEALHLSMDQIPRVTLPGTDIRVVLGTIAGTTSPLKLPTSAAILDVNMGPHAQWEVDLAQGDHAFAFMLGGKLNTSGHSAAPGQLLRTRATGAAWHLLAGAQGARFTLFAGTPLRQPRVMQGPFVANDPQQLMRFATNHAAGNFGSLRPFNTQSA